MSEVSSLNFCFHVSLLKSEYHQQRMVSAHRHFHTLAKIQVSNILETSHKTTQIQKFEPLTDRMKHFVFSKYYFLFSFSYFSQKHIKYNGKNRYWTLCDQNDIWKTFFRIFHFEPYFKFVWNWNLVIFLKGNQRNFGSDFLRKYFDS